MPAARPQRARRRSARENADSKVEAIDPNVRGYHMVLRVASVKLMLERRRPSGELVRIAEAVVGDETGCIVLTVRNGA